jgi:hypothetical protein
MINFNRTEGWFLLDKVNQQVVRFSNGEIVNYGIYDEAMDDCYGNECVVEFDELPNSEKQEWLKQMTEY